LTRHVLPGRSHTVTAGHVSSIPTDVDAARGETRRPSYSLAGGDIVGSVNERRTRCVTIKGAKTRRWRRLSAGAESHNHIGVAGHVVPPPNPARSPSSLYLGVGVARPTHRLCGAV